MTPVYPIEKALGAQAMAIKPRQPQPDDAVLGGQSLAPLDGAVLGGIEGVKQRFELGDIEQKKQALDQALQYGDRGLGFLATVSNEEFPVEVKGYAKRLWALESLKKSGDNSLVEINLESTDLSWANLRGANLKGVNLTGSNLRGSDLKLANLNSVDLKSADLQLTDLRGVDLRGVDFRGASLKGSIVNSNTQMDAKWLMVWEIVNQGASNRDLRGTDLMGADLKDTDLRGADLRGADLCWADLRRTVINANTQMDAKWLMVWEIVNHGASNRDLSGADLKGADLAFANLSKTDLSGADLFLTNLGGANLSGANLSWSDLRGAVLMWANLTGANLRGAKINLFTKIDEQWRSSPWWSSLKQVIF